MSSAEDFNPNRVVYGRYFDKVGNEQYAEPNTVRNGLTLRNIMIVVMILTILVIVLCGIGIEKTEKHKLNHYLFISGCSLASLAFIIEIIFVSTTVRSLMVEDIMASSIQRIAAGTAQVGDFQANAGNYFKNRLFSIGDDISDRAAGRIVGANLLDTQILPTS